MDEARDEGAAAVFDRFARFYDADYRDYEEDIPLILELAESSEGQVLELGCGTGRVLAPLAAANHAVTGVDISRALLAVAAQKLAHLGLDRRVTLVEGDLRTFSLQASRGPFGFVFCTSNTLMHLAKPGEQLTVLRNAARCLTPGGVLMLDLFNPDIARLMEVNGVMELADQWDDAETGAQVLKWSVRLLDLAAQIQYTTFIYEEIFDAKQLSEHSAGANTRKTVCTFPLRFLWRNEAELMLAQAGFVTRAVWGDFEGGEYDSASERLILVAEKQR